MAHRAFGVALQSSLRGAITTRPRTASKLSSITLGSLSLARNTGLSTLPRRQLQRGLHVTGRFGGAYRSRTEGPSATIIEGYFPWSILLQEGLTKEEYGVIAAKIEVYLYTGPHAMIRPTEEDSIPNDRFEVYVFYREPAEGGQSKCDLMLPHAARR